MISLFSPLMLRLAAAAIALLLFAGCPSAKPTTGTTEGGDAPAPPVEPSGPKTYALSDLQVGVRDYLPPLDDGRIEIAAPEGWEIGSRQQGYVAWFPRFKDAKTLPQIRVTAEDTPPDAVKDVSKENVEEFAKWLAGYVKQDLKKDDELIEPVKPLILGDNAFGRYVRKGRYREADAEQHILVTARGGRLYTLNQLVIKGDLSKPDIRDAAYAVGAGMKFQAGGSLTPEPSVDPPVETPLQ